MEIVYHDRKLVIKYCHTRLSSFFIETEHGEIIESLFFDAKNLVMNRVNSMIKQKQTIVRLKIYIIAHETATKILEKILSLIKFCTDKITFDLTNKHSEPKQINYYHVDYDCYQYNCCKNGKCCCANIKYYDVDNNRISYDFDIRNFEKIIYLFSNLIKHTTKLKVIQTYEHYNFFERVIAFANNSNKLSVLSLIVDRQNSNRCESIKLNVNINSKIKKIKCNGFDIITIINLPSNMSQFDIIGSYGTIINCEIPISKTTLVAVTINLRKSVYHNKTGCITDFLATDIKINKLYICEKVFKTAMTDLVSSSNFGKIVIITKIIQSIINSTTLQELCIRVFNKLDTTLTNHLQTIISNNNIKYFETTDLTTFVKINGINNCDRIKLLHTMVLTDYDVDLFMTVVNSMTCITNIIVDLTIIINNVENDNSYIINKLFTWMQHSIRLQKINFCYNKHINLDLFWINLNLCFKYLVNFYYVNTIKIHKEDNINKIKKKPINNLLNQNIPFANLMVLDPHNSKFSRFMDNEEKMRSIYNIIEQNPNIIKFTGCLIDDVMKSLLDKNIKYSNNIFFKKTKVLISQS